MGVSTYAYDPNGNRVTHATPTSIDSGSYDAQDRMLSYGNGVYVYARKGELREKIEGSDTTRYTYDYFGNLITVVLPNKNRIDYLIDGQNRRIGKKINGLIIRRWIYSGQLSPIAELDSANNVRAQFVGSLMIKGGNTYQLIRDHLGSVRLFVDVNTGTIAQQIDYDEFGNVTYDSNPDFQPFGYADGLYDSQTKLMRFGARDYEASAGRWTCKDPILFGGGVSNVYEYCVNEPVNRVDRGGLQTITLPPDPSQLPPEWQIDPTHQDPNGVRMRSPGGDYLDFHKGQPGAKGWKGKDHYHHNGGKEHLEPGDEIEVSSPEGTECPDSQNGSEPSQFSIPKLTQQQWDNIRNAGWVGAAGIIIIGIVLLPVGI